MPLSSAASARRTQPSGTVQLHGHGTSFVGHVRLRAARKLEVAGLAHPDKAAERAFSITSGGVDQNAGHQRALKGGHVQAFAKGRRAVSALKGQSVDEEVCERVQ